MTHGHIAPERGIAIPDDDDKALQWRFEDSEWYWPYISRGSNLGASRRSPFLGPQLGANFCRFFLGEGSLLKSTTEESWHPYSNLSTGGPSFASRRQEVRLPPKPIGKPLGLTPSLMSLRFGFGACVEKRVPWVPPKCLGVPVGFPFQPKQRIPSRNENTHPGFPFWAI